VRKRGALLQTRKKGSCLLPPMQPSAAKTTGCTDMAHYLGAPGRDCLKGLCPLTHSPALGDTQMQKNAA